MGRQVNLPEDVYGMLWVLKSSPSQTYGEIILGLIEDAVPSLPRRYRRIKRLDQRDPKEADYQLFELQQDMIQEYTIPRLIEKKENHEEEYEAYLEEQEEAIEEHFALLDSESEKKEASPKTKSTKTRKTRVKK
jgi:hypothetical protein